MRATGNSAGPTMKYPSENQPQEVLAGLVERVTYHNAENGFCVLRAKARGHRDVVTVVGHAATIAAGEWITASGEWVNDRTHGQQFKARFLRTSLPTSADGIEKYLASGMIRGVGPVYAKKLLRAFGEKVFDVIEATPDRLREVNGIGPVRAAGIVAAWAEQKAVREIIHAKVRSTTHLRGRTSNPCAVSERLIISSVHSPIRFNASRSFSLA